MLKAILQSYHIVSVDAEDIKSQTLSISVVQYVPSRAINMGTAVAVSNLPSLTNNRAEGRFVMAINFRVIKISLP